MADRGPARHQIAPFIRKAFLEAMQIHAAGKNMSAAEIIAEAIEENGLLPVMQTVSKFQERVSTSTVNVDGSVKHEGLPSVDSFLHEYVVAAADRDDASPGEDRPLLPH